MENFGKRLKRLRTDRQLTPRQVSVSTGIPLSTYREWEAGRQIKGQPYVFLARVFEVSLYELLTGQPAKKTECFELIEKIKVDLEKLKENLRSYE